jgi:hypothetical protein
MCSAAWMGEARMTVGVFHGNTLTLAILALVLLGIGFAANLDGEA